MTSGNRLVLKRIYPTNAARLYRMWTDEALLKQWFCPGADMSVPVAELDVRVGGHYRVVMQNKDGETYSPAGTYEEVVPGKRLVFSWQWSDSEVVTRVSVEFREISPAETELTLTHSGFPDGAVRDSHEEGWDGCLALLGDTI